jgi:hypothetical protein
MRRLALLAALVLLPAALAAQIEPGGQRPRRGFDEEPQDTLPSNATRGYQFGVTSYTGGWVPSALELGILFRTRGVPFSTVGLGLRLGSFIQNNAVLFGRTNGFFVGVLGSARLPLASLWMVGSERNPTFVRFEAVLDASASWNIDNPMGQGSTSLLAAPLVGFSIGGRGPMDQTFFLLAGPAWFGPRNSAWHTQVSLRFSAPIGGRSARTPPPS